MEDEKLKCPGNSLNNKQDEAKKKVNSIRFASSSTRCFLRITSRSLMKSLSDREREREKERKRERESKQTQTLILVVIRNSICVTDLFKKIDQFFTFTLSSIIQILPFNQILKCKNQLRRENPR